MKKILSLLALMLITVAGFSQAPGFFNYQGVARNSVGNVLKNQAIALRLTIHDGAAAGPVVYQETRSTTTNPFGLFNVQVGSSGATNVTGTIAGVNWGVGTKFIQVEIDPANGTTFINIGTAQLASVPYSLFSALSGDLVLPFNKTQADAGTLFKITNSGTGAGSTALEGLTNSTAGNANAIIGTVTSASPGGFSAGVRGVNNGSGGLGIGVYGSQNGSGWGVYGTTPSGIGVNGASASGFGVYGSSTSGTGVYGTSSTGRPGFFENTNAANTFDALTASTNGAASSWAIRATSTGAQGAGIFTYNNAASAANALRVSSNGTGFAANITNSNAVPLALRTQGGLQFTGIGETVDYVLRSDASGNATWVNPLSLPGGNLWTRVGTNLWNTNLGDNVGVGTTTPAYRFEVVHGGSTGIRSRSTAGFSVVDIDAQSGDAALRFYANGAGQWNLRNQPGTNNLELFELGGGGTRMIVQDGTGNFGIGQTNPSYRLDVQHGGSTGIRSQSTSSFSVVDIDAQNGDAALRFAKNGTNMWNNRNRPGDDYLEWFELGGGGSRMVIQRGTGNVGIGETNNPTYKLDVLHGGSTGERIRSSASFSVLDIDAATGDAAIRLADNGVNQWNIRNQPGTDNLQVFELGGGGERLQIQDGTGNVGIGGVSPSYRLHVLHGGATGIKSQSAAGSGSFSVVDIDADNGDAALRYQRAGVGQWNVRNRPADDYYEIFELGGGGSRFVIQDGTGNVGIGETANPVYKLDVLHGGATGIRSRSSSSFSVVDIDAASGDAALRFAKAGVNQWNVRNRPADDYFEIFELGGGGSRFVIQDGTGNVGIGESANPTYKLDVLHGGATGIRDRSSSTFSVFDIDAANGDAALRFAKAGVNQWNTRNNPATDDYQIFELGGGGERLRIENTTGNVVIPGNLAKGGGSFRIDHPLDPENKYLYHSFVESPDMMNIYNGNVVTDASGKATIKLPDYFEALNKDFRYQLTVIGSFAQAMISKEVANNSFEITSNQPNVKISWQVTGIRHDAYANMNRIPTEVDKAPKDRGTYVHPKAFNQPVTKGENYYDVKGTSSSLTAVLDGGPAKPAPATTGGSLDQGPIIPPSTVKATEKGTSLEQTAPAKPAAKTAEKGGSIEDMPKATENKNAPATKGGSTEDMPKPAESKKPSADPGSTKTE